MKNYNKPEIEIKKFVSDKTVASLRNWLEEGEGTAYQGAGITTYIVES